jgi:membrane protein YqaA with SNARE-associated domain
MTLIAQILGGLLGWGIAYLMYLYVHKKEKKQAAQQAEIHRREIEKAREEMRSKYKTKQ